MDRMAVGDGGHLVLVEQLDENPRAGDLEHVGQGVLLDVLYDSLNEPGNIGIPRPAGDEVVAQLPPAGGYVEFIPLGTEHAGERPDLVGVDIQVDAAKLVQDQQAPEVGLGGTDL